VNDKVTRFLSIIPQGIKTMKRTEDKMNNPLFRFLEREVTVATKLLTNIQKNSVDIQNMCNGKILATNLLR
jgi:dynein heavy chain 1